MKKINDLKSLLDKQIVNKIRQRDLLGKYLKFKENTQSIVNKQSLLVSDRFIDAKNWSSVMFEQKIMSRIDKNDLAEKYFKFKNKAQNIVTTRFGGNYENFYITVVGSFGLLCAILILVFAGNSAPSGGHGGHGGEEHGEHEDEGRSVELSDDAIESSGIKLNVVKKLAIHRVVKLRGQISVNRDRYTEISSRYSGTVQSVTKNLGDVVVKGDVLARVESVAARASFDVRSGISGVIVGRQAIRGLFVSDKAPMFTVVDLSTVWAELNASDTDFQSLKVGQKIKILDAETGKSTETVVSYVSPNVYEDTQSIVIRAVIDNKDQNWRPGSFIEAEINVEDKDVALAIEVNAVQTVDDKPVIFVKDGEFFEVRDVVLGTSDRKYVELLSGAADGETYIGSNSFIAKAQLLKSSAEHEH